jgi:hypothetical protein
MRLHRYAAILSFSTRSNEFYLSENPTMLQMQDESHVQNEVRREFDMNGKTTEMNAHFNPTYSSTPLQQRKFYNPNWYYQSQLYQQQQQHEYQQTFYQPQQQPRPAKTGTPHWVKNKKNQSQKKFKPNKKSLEDVSDMSCDNFYNRFLIFLFPTALCLLQEQWGR